MRPTELDDWVVGVGGGRVGEMGFGPKLMSSYSTQSLVLQDESSSSVRLSSGKGEVGVVSVSSEPLTVTLISLKCFPALLAATHLYMPSSAPDMEDRTREPLERME